MAEERSRQKALLTPSLSQTVGIAPLYSVGTGVVLGFFGGPVAAGLIMAINARRLGRLAQDAWLYAVVFVVSGVIFVLLVDHPELFVIELGDAGQPRNMRRFLFSGLGLLTMGLLYVKYRTYYRAMTMSGLESPSPWKTGLAVLVIALALQFALVFVVGFARYFWTYLVDGHA